MCQHEHYTQLANSIHVVPYAQEQPCSYNPLLNHLQYAKQRGQFLQVSCEIIPGVLNNECMVLMLILNALVSSGWLDAIRKGPQDALPGTFSFLST